MKKILLLALFLTVFCKAQDTIQYSCGVVMKTEGKTSEILLYESFELHPGNFVKWNSEYDLTFSEYGKYAIEGDTLKLELYSSKNMDLNDTSHCFKVVDSLAASNAKPYQVKYYLISGDNLTFLTLKGKRLKPVKRIYDHSLPRTMGWLFGNGRKYIYRKTEM
jgi:hypothetical protein